MIFGAVYGDIIGSYYETHCTKDYEFPLHNESSFTDDTVLTAAVCEAVIRDERLNDTSRSPFMLGKRARKYAAQYRRFYSLYPNAGFGQMFSDWVQSSTPYRQKSYGNGAAMRAVPIGCAYAEMKRVLWEAKASCIYTHNSREAIKGAQSVAAAVWHARNGSSKDEIRAFIEREFGYELSVPIAELRGKFVFDSRAGYSVPPAIAAFLQSEDYESAVRNAVSLGGDADTMACIAGGIAEAYYGEGSIPRHIADFCGLRLDGTIKRTINSFNDRLLTKDEK